MSRMKVYNLATATWEYVGGVSATALAADAAFTAKYAPRTSGAGAPSGTGIAGDLYYDTTNKRLYLSDGVGWIIMSEPENTSWVPTWNNVTLGTGGSKTGRYHRSDGYVDFHILLVLGTGGGFTGTLSFDLPMAHDVVHRGAINLTVFRSGVNEYQGANEAGGSGTASLTVLAFNVSGTTVTYSVVNATTPWTWVANDKVSVSGRVKMLSKYA